MIGSGSTLKVHRRGTKWMPNTGLFYLLDVIGDASQEDPQALSRLTFVRAQCLQCHAILSLSGAPGLVNVAHGAAVLTCERCKNRQAISGARFADLVRRVEHGLIPTVGDIPQAPGASGDDTHLHRH
ncbi:hypothetical protein DBR34_00860 [Stenotrophomonas sp. HMWF003]|nr:hypothetical protein DBR34_00860 [Stenotrophomonas sp. HMWF003]